MAAIVVPYAIPCVAFGRGDVVVIATADTTVMPKLLVNCELMLSVTVTEKDDAKVLVGVPDKVPELASVKPAGNVPAVTAQLNGATPPMALNVKE